MVYVLLMMKSIDSVIKAATAQRMCCYVSVFGCHTAKLPAKI
jgi:hypothetical protein